MYATVIPRARVVAREHPRRVLREVHRVRTLADGDVAVLPPDDVGRPVARVVDGGLARGLTRRERPRGHDQLLGHGAVDPMWRKLPDVRSNGKSANASRSSGE
jgi:hypothetical protein